MSHLRGGRNNNRIDVIVFQQDLIIFNSSERASGRLNLGKARFINFRDMQLTNEWTIRASIRTNATAPASSNYANVDFFYNFSPVLKIQVV